jgi:hypothetical protein
MQSRGATQNDSAVAEKGRTLIIMNNDPIPLPESGEILN